MKLRVIILASMLALLAFASPGSAGSADREACNDNPDQGHCVTVEEYCSTKRDAEACEQQIREQCENDPSVGKCAKFIFEIICQTVIIHGGAPQVGEWDPILGIVEIHDYDCQDYFREESDGDLQYLFTVEKAESGLYTIHQDHA